MKIKKSVIIDLIIYVSFFIFIMIDFVMSYNTDKSIAVQLTFLIIGLVAYIDFAKDKNFISINRLIDVFLFLFMYYAAFHQFLLGTTYWGLGSFNEDNYLYANFLIILFMAIYYLTYNFAFKKKTLKVKQTPRFAISEVAFIIMSIGSIVSIVFLLATGELFSMSSDDDGSSSLWIIILKIVRYFPVSSLLMIIFLKQSNVKKDKSLLKITCTIIISISAFIVFFPLNGSISRYLLFGTYLMLFASYFTEIKHGSFLLLILVIGFYFIFPAFNFFKYHTIYDLSEFSLGGFDVTANDYDAYYMFLVAIKYVDSNSVMAGTNILSAVLCFIPRSVWTGKLQASGYIISGYFGATFNNVSCPLFAEFYLAFHIPGIIFGTVGFALFVRLLEKGRSSNNIILKGLHYMVLGLILASMRGALLPFMSFTISIFISFMFVYVVVRLTRKIVIDDI